MCLIVFNFTFICVLLLYFFWIRSTLFSSFYWLFDFYWFFFVFTNFLEILFLVDFCYFISIVFFLDFIFFCYFKCLFSFFCVFLINLASCFVFLFQFWLILGVELFKSFQVFCNSFFFDFAFNLFSGYFLSFSLWNFFVIS